MGIKLTKDKNSKVSKIFIRSILIIAALSTLIFIGLFFMQEDGTYIYAEFLEGIDGIIQTLAIISIGSCWVYYYIYKKDEFFLITLLYLSLGVEIICSNIIVHNIGNQSIGMLTFSLSTYFVRTIILSLTVIKVKSVINWIINNKTVASIGLVILTLILVNLEMYLKVLGIINVTVPFVGVITYLLIAYHFVILAFIAKKSVVEEEIIYSIIVSSLNFFVIKRLYSYNYISSFKQQGVRLTDVLTCIGFWVLIIGLFMEMIRKVQEGERLNEALKTSESKLNSINENIKDLIFNLDCNGKIDYVNNTVLNVLGYAKEELLGASYKEVLWLEDDIYSNIFLKKDNKDTFIQQKFKCKDGSEVVMESVITNIFNDKGEVISKVIVSRDIAIRDELEVLKKKYNDIKEYDNIRTEFFANLSHEVRTPVNILDNCLQLLNKSKKNGIDSFVACYDKYEKTIKQNCHRILRLINNLLDISKIDSGFMDMNFKNSNIVNVVEDITLSIIPYVESKKINILFDTEIEELYVKCDSENIERVMLNLLSNSIKFTEKGGNILVDLSLEDKWVKIRVKDDGSGIPKEFRAFIFDRFIQINKGFNRTKEGSGIGLALVKSIIEMHEGQVYVADNEDKGAEIIVKIPNAKLEENEGGGMSQHQQISEKISIEFSDIYDL